MSLTLVLVGIVVFAFAAGHWLTRSLSRFITLSGAEYMLVGILIGPHMPWALLGPSALAQLEPVMYLLIGLAGFGLGLFVRRIARHAELGLVASVSSLGVFATCTAGFLLVLSHSMPTSDAADFILRQELFEWRGRIVELWVSSEQLWVGLGLGACATVSSSGAIKRAGERRGSGRAAALLAACAGVSEVVGVLALGLVLAAVRATNVADGASMTVVEWSLSTIALGVVCGVLFGLFIGRESDTSRMFLATVGLVTFASGVGSALGVSPLFTNLLAGITVSVTSPHAEALTPVIKRLQHPVFVLLMIFAGTLWAPTSGLMWLLPLSYLALRLVASGFWVGFAQRLILQTPLAVPRLGNALVGQGALAVAIGLNLALRAPEHADILLTTVLVGVLLSDLFSGRLLAAVLADAGELEEFAPSAELAAEPEEQEL